MAELKRKKRKIVRKDPDQLRAHPWQGKMIRDYDDAQMDRFVEKLKEEGQLQVVEILPDGLVLDGWQRRCALKKLGRRVRCWVRDDLKSDDEINRRFINANLTRRQMSKLDQARAYKALRETERGPNRRGTGDFRDFIAKRFGVSGRTLDRWSRVLQTPEEVQFAVDDGKLSMQEAEYVSRLSWQQQKEIAEKIREGVDPRKVVGELNKKPKGGPTDRSTSPQKYFRHFVRGAGRLRQRIKGLERDARLTVTQHDIALLTWLRKQCKLAIQEAKESQAEWDAAMEAEFGEQAPDSNPTSVNPAVFSAPLP